MQTINLYSIRGGGRSLVTEDIPLAINTVHANYLNNTNKK